MPPVNFKEPVWERAEHRLPEIYLALALLLTLLLCWMTPPFFPADEPTHAYRAISLVHGHLTERTVGDDMGDDIDSGLVHAIDQMDDMRLDWEKHARFYLDRGYGPIADQQLSRVAGDRWSGQKVFAPFANTAVYPPLLYLPGMAGWRIGEAAGWTAFADLHLARVLYALCAVVLGWLALRFCTGVRCVLFAGLMLPSVLYLNATCTQDALVPGLAALAVAMLSRALAERREFTRAELAAAAIAVGSIALARPPYAPMALMLFVPTAELRARWQRWIEPGLAFATVGVVTALWWRSMPQLEMVSNELGEPGAQRIFLREHPFAATLTVLHGTGSAGLDFFHHGLYTVGLNDPLPHNAVAAVLTICLLAIVLFARGPVVESRRVRILLAVCVTAPLLGISLAEYLIWTTPGGSTVLGVQSRYWLAAMPLGILLLQSFVPRRVSSLQWMRVGGIAAAAVIALVACTLPWMVAHAFYREGVWHVLMLNLR